LVQEENPIACAWQRAQRIPIALPVRASIVADGDWTLLPGELDVEPPLVGNALRPNAVANAVIGGAQPKRGD
jgi:hypothetical protein